MLPTTAETMQGKIKVIQGMMANMCERAKIQQIKSRKIGWHDAEQMVSDSQVNACSAFGLAS